MRAATTNEIDDIVREARAAIEQRIPTLVSQFEETIAAFGASYQQRNMLSE